MEQLFLMDGFRCRRGLTPNSLPFAAPSLIPHTFIHIQIPNLNPFLMTANLRFDLLLLETLSHPLFRLMQLDEENTEKDDSDDCAEEDGVDQGGHDKTDTGGEDVWIYAALQTVSLGE